MVSRQFIRNQMMQELIDTTMKRNVILCCFLIECMDSDGTLKTGNATSIADLLVTSVE
jgi:hypothetical protein